MPATVCLFLDESREFHCYNRTRPTTRIAFDAFRNGASYSSWVQTVALS